MTLWEVRLSLWRSHFLLFWVQFLATSHILSQLPYYSREWCTSGSWNLGANSTIIAEISTRWNISDVNRTVQKYPIGHILNVTTFSFVCCCFILFWKEISPILSCLEVGSAGGTNKVFPWWVGSEVVFSWTGTVAGCLGLAAGSACSFSEDFMVGFIAGALCGPFKETDC